MGRTVNRVTLMGNIGRLPEVTYTPTGVKLAQMRLATEDSWVDREGAVKIKTDWHNVVAWRGLADIVEKLIDKGTYVYVEGHLHTYSYDDKEGNKRYGVEVVAENIVVLDGRKPREGEQNGLPETSHSGSISDTPPEAPF